MSEYPSRDFTSRELKLSYWYITHKLSLRRWLIVSLISFSVLLWFYIGWQSVFYIINYSSEQSQINRLPVSQNSNLLSIESLRPRDLQFSGINILPSAGGRYDFISNVTNPNSNWLVTFDYQFSVLGVNADVKKGFVLPSEEKSIMDLGADGNEVELKISNIKWQRVYNYPTIKSNKLRLAITDQEFIKSQLPGDPSMVVFTIVNASAYSYWEVGTQIFLFSGTKMVSANFISLEKLISGESREVEVFWNDSLPRITNIQIVPEVNILDEDNIISQI